MTINGRGPWPQHQGVNRKKQKLWWPGEHSLTGSNTAIMPSLPQTQKKQENWFCMQNPPNLKADSHFSKHLVWANPMISAWLDLAPGRLILALTPTWHSTLLPNTIRQEVYVPKSHVWGVSRELAHEMMMPQAHQELDGLRFCFLRHDWGKKQLHIFKDMQQILQIKHCSRFGKEGRF